MVILNVYCTYSLIEWGTSYAYREIVEYTSYAPFFSYLKGCMIVNFPTFKTVPKHSQGQDYRCEPKAFSALSRICEYQCGGY